MTVNGMIPYLLAWCLAAGGNGVEQNAHANAPTTLNDSEQKVYYQAVACGPVSLFVLLTKMGKAPDLVDLAEKCRVDEKGGSHVQDMQRAASSYGVALEAMEIDFSLFETIPPPFIVLLKKHGSSLGHFACVTKFEGHYIHTVDYPALDIRKPLEEIKDRWTSIVLVDAATAHTLIHSQPVSRGRSAFLAGAAIPAVIALAGRFRRSSRGSRKSIAAP